MVILSILFLQFSKFSKTKGGQTHPGGKLAPDYGTVVHKKIILLFQCTVNGMLKKLITNFYDF